MFSVLPMPNDLAMTTQRAIHVCSMLTAFVLGGGTLLANAAPTPVPGGANQTSGVSGSMSQTLFNGTLRIKGMSLKDAGPADHINPNAPGERALVFRSIVSNGTKHEHHGYFDASLADANGITIAGRPLDSGWSLEPGAAAHAVNGFSVPHDFVPVRLVLIESAHPKARAFRIAVRPSDLGAAPAPAATP
jgi:hypothetical protein